MANKSAVARIRWRYMQRLGITLMCAQAGMLFNTR
jgi:hypothetical protein